MSKEIAAYAGPTATLHIGGATKQWKYVPVELNGMKEALLGGLFEEVFDYDENGVKYELKVPISWKTIKAIHKAIIADAPNPPGPGFRTVYQEDDVVADKLKGAAEKACALLEQMGEEIRWTAASWEIINNLRSRLDED